MPFPHIQIPMHGNHHVVGVKFDCLHPGQCAHQPHQYTTLTYFGQTGPTAAPPTLCKLAVDKYLVCSASCALLNPVYRRPVSFAKHGLPLCQQHVWEMAIEQDPGLRRQALEHWDDGRHLVDKYDVIVLAAPASLDSRYQRSKQTRKSLTSDTMS